VTVKLKTISNRTLTALLRDVIVHVLVQAMLVSSMSQRAFGGAPAEAKRAALPYGETYGPEVLTANGESDIARESPGVLGTELEGIPLLPRWKITKS